MNSKNPNYHGYKPVAPLARTAEETKNKVKELYLQGFSQTYIEKALKMTRKTIRTILKEAEIDRTKSKQWQLRWGTELNEEVFDINKLTPASEYWIGLLYADGHISDGKRGKSVEIGLHSQDSEHLQKYLDFLNCNKKIDCSRKHSEYCRVRIGSEKIHSDLQTLGFSNNKSLTAAPPEILKNSRDFWRGVMDGDGSLCFVSTRKYPFIHLCGTYDTTFEFLEFIKRNGVTTKVMPHLSINEFTKHPLYQVSFACKKAVQVADILYKDATIYLDRKYQKYQQEFIQAA